MGASLPGDSADHPKTGRDRIERRVAASETGSNPIVVGPMRRRDLSEASRIIMEAFRDDPMMAAVYGRTRSSRRLRAYFWIVLWMGVCLDWQLCARVHGRLAGLVTVIPTKPSLYPPMSLRRLLGPLESGVAICVFIFSLPFLLPPWIVVRSVRMGLRMEKPRPKTAHFYVEALAVHPEYQGRGVGTALMEAVAERARRKEAPVYLDTVTESNVRWYERLGFEVVGEQELRGVHNRLLRWPADSDATDTDTEAGDATDPGAGTPRT